MLSKAYLPSWDKDLMSWEVEIIHYLDLYVMFPIHRFKQLIINIVNVFVFLMYLYKGLGGVCPHVFKGQKHIFKKQKAVLCFLSSNFLSPYNFQPNIISLYETAYGCPLLHRANISGVYLSRAYAMNYFLKRLISPSMQISFNYYKTQASPGDWPLVLSWSTLLFKQQHCCPEVNKVHEKRVT